MRHKVALSIRSKLLASFGAMFLLTLALGVFSISQIAAENAHVTELTSRIVPATRMVGEASALINRYRKDQLHYILATPADRRGADGINGDLARDSSDMSALLRSYRAQGLVADAADARLLSTFQRDFETYAARTAAFRTLADQGRSAAAGAVVGTGPGDAAFDALKAAGTNWQSYNARLSTAAAKTAHADFVFDRLLVVVMLAVALASARPAPC